MHNKSYKNQAIERGDAIYLNEIKYSPIPSSDLNEYTISNVLICKTDTGIKLYEINEYPDYKYIAGYHAWGGEIYKKQTDKEGEVFYGRIIKITEYRKKLKNSLFRLA